MNTRSITRIIATLTSVISLAQASAQEASELIGLKERYQKAIEIATDPINKKYLQELIILQERYTKQGNLDSALAVKAEIASFSSEQVESELQGEWILSANGSNYSGPRNLLADRSMVTENGPTGTWIVKNNKLIIKFKNGSIDEFQLPMKNKKLQGKNSRGQSITLTKVK